MTLYEQRRYIKKLTLSNLEKNTFRYIKTNLVQIMIEMQKKQIFILSQGSDGIQLGYYQKQKNKRKNPTEGAQYDMIFTGKLKEGIKVRVTLTYAEFSSYPGHTKDIQNRDFWGTKNWFGLNDGNLDKLINDHLIDEARRLTLNVITTGKWI